MEKYTTGPPQMSVTVHAPLWPALPIVQLHPSENVVVSGAIAEAVLPPKFATYKNPLSSLKAMPRGDVTTGMGVPTTMFVAGVITKTLLLSMFTTYIKPLLGLKAISIGSILTGVYPQR